MSISYNAKIAIWLILTILFTTFSFYGWQVLTTANLNLDKPARILYIPAGANYTTVLDSLKRHQTIHHLVSFRFLARLLSYPDKIRPGAYRIESNMSNLAALRMLRSGKQTPIRLVLKTMRTKEDLLDYLDKNMEFSTLDLAAILNNPDSCAKLGFNDTTIVAMFLPNTYEMYWNMRPAAFIKKMKSEYEKFWTLERRTKASNLGLNPIQAITLASIVEAETKKLDEMPVVAGVYLNRLRILMPLQADPTVVFAVQDFTIKRIRRGHTLNPSRYNTYKYIGLPPGPINLPSLKAIDATLAAQTHQYIFFCAKEDFSGYHNFAITYEAHLQNARKYSAALDAANIQ